MQAAEPSDPFGSGVEHQMIGVAEHDVGAERLDLMAVHRLDRAGRADGHEGRRADFAARADDLAVPRRSVAGKNVECESVGHAAPERQPP